MARTITTTRTIDPDDVTCTIARGVFTFDVSGVGTVVLRALDVLTAAEATTLRALLRRMGDRALALCGGV